MGTITTRARKGGDKHTAQIRIKRNGTIVHTEAQTFDRRQAAEAWMKKREVALSEPGVLEKLMGPKEEDPTLSECIAKCIDTSNRATGKTKAQVLRAIQAHPIGALKCSRVTSQEIVKFAQSLASQPQTVGNYLSHLASIFAVSKPAFGYPLDPEQMNAARVVCQRMSITSRSKQRTRRPTMAELDALMEHFGRTKWRQESSPPMQEVLVYAIFSTRRLEEIFRANFEDLDEAHSEIWVRDMKHPGEKIGNDVMTKLDPVALRMIQRQRKHPGQVGRIFPYNCRTVSSTFTRACQILGIDDLHFHDLRHDGVSRLFEIGWNIPQVSQVSGHRTWTSLKRYTHMRQSGDKYADWKWLQVLGVDQDPQPGATRPTDPTQCVRAFPSAPS